MNFLVIQIKTHTHTDMGIHIIAHFHLWWWAKTKRHLTISLVNPINIFFMYSKFHLAWPELKWSYLG